MDYALIKNGTVVNVIIADSNTVNLVAADYDHVEPLESYIAAGSGVGIGWGWNGGFVAPETEEA